MRTSNGRGWPRFRALAVVGAAVVLVAAGCSYLPAAPQPPLPSSKAVPAVRAAPVQRGAIAQILFYSGDVRAKNQVAVVPKVAEQVDKLLVDVGDAVEAGQPLAVLEHEILEAQVEQAQAGLALAKVRLATLEEGPRAEMVGQAAANLRLVEARLAALKAGPLKPPVEAAEAAVREARNQLYAVEAQAQPYLRLGQPEDVVGMVLFLCSEACRTMYGQIIYTKTP